MRKKLEILSLIIGMLFIYTNPVFGEEKMESPEKYQESLEIDLDGDGETEQITYVSTEEYNDAYQAHLEIYEDKRLIYEAMSEPGAYGWYLFSIEDKYLWGQSKGDNDFCCDVILLEYTKDGTLQCVGNMEDMVISDWDGQNMKLSDWVNFRCISSVEGNKVQAGGMISTKCAGVIWDVEVTCVWTEDGLIVNKEMRPTISNENKWTASQDFSLYKEPGTEEVIHQVKRSDTVKLLSVTWKDNMLYLECETSSGEKGWIQDRKQDEWDWSLDDRYFEENRYL